MAYIETLNGLNIAPKDAVRAFATVSDMQAATDLDVGVTCHTNGNATVGDGGDAYYTVGTSGDIALQGGLYATQATTAPNELQDTLFANKRIMIFGDSWTGAYTGGDAFNPQTYIDSLGVFAGSRKYSQGGAGFSTVGDDSATSFLELANSIVTPNRFGIVLIVGGVNDGDTVNATDIKNVVDKIKEKCPYATLYYAQNIVRTARGSRLRAMRNRDFELAKNGVQILDVYSRFWNRTDYYHTDWYHLTAEGYKRFYSECISQICGGSSFILPTGYTNIKPQLFDVHANVTVNDAILIHHANCSQVQFHITVNTTLPSASAVLCKIPYGYFLHAPSTTYKSVTMYEDAAAQTPWMAVYMEEAEARVYAQKAYAAGTHLRFNLIQGNGETLIQQSVNSGAFLEV